MLQHTETPTLAPSQPHWTPDHVASLVEVFVLYSDPTRVRVVWALTAGERQVNEIAETVGAPVSTVSRHLAKLRAAHLVTSRRAGTSRLYRLVNDYAARLIADTLATSAAAREIPVRPRRTPSRDAAEPV